MTERTIYNIYCDESCHLENDHQKAMVLGAVWCPVESIRRIADNIKRIKRENGLAPWFEIKWTKVSQAKLALYCELFNYFFSEPDLHFRALVVPDKSILRHDDFHQDHDTWYYKMYFDMLKVIIRPDAEYQIFLDIKDTNSSSKVRELHEVLCNNMYDFDRNIIKSIQTVRSHEVQQIQLADLLIGAVGYANRGLASSAAKLQLVDLLKTQSHYSLLRSTLLAESKFNLFRWESKRGSE
jgi:hypothetical protein